MRINIPSIKSFARTGNRPRLLAIISLSAALVAVLIIVCSAGELYPFSAASRTRHRTLNTVHLAAEGTRRTFQDTVRRFGLEYLASEPVCYRYEASDTKGYCEEVTRMTGLPVSNEVADSFIANSQRLADTVVKQGWTANDVNPSRSWTEHRQDAPEWLKTDFLEVRYTKDIDQARCGINLSVSSIGKGKLEGYIDCTQDTDGRGLSVFPG